MKVTCSSGNISKDPKSEIMIDASNPTLNFLEEPSANTLPFKILHYKIFNKEGSILVFLCQICRLRNDSSATSKNSFTVISIYSQNFYISGIPSVLGSFEAMILIASALPACPALISIERLSQSLVTKLVPFHPMVHRNQIFIIIISKIIQTSFQLLRQRETHFCSDCPSNFGVPLEKNNLKTQM